MRKARSPAFRAFGLYTMLCVAANFPVGCATTHIDTSHTKEPGRQASGSVRVLLYENVSAEHKKTPIAEPVLTRLYLLAPAGPEQIHETTRGSWSLEGLRPGRYRLDVLSMEPGDKSPPKRIEKEEFTVEPGTEHTVSVIVTDRRGIYWTLMGLGIAGIVTAVVAALIHSINTSCKSASISGSRRPAFLSPGSTGLAPLAGPLAA